MPEESKIFAELKVPLKVALSAAEHLDQPRRVILYMALLAMAAQGSAFSARGLLSAAGEVCKAHAREAGEV